MHQAHVAGMAASHAAGTTRAAGTPSKRATATPTQHTRTAIGPSTSTSAHRSTHPSKAWGNAARIVCLVLFAAYFIGAALLCFIGLFFIGSFPMTESGVFGESMVICNLLAQGRFAYFAGILLVLAVFVFALYLFWRSGLANANPKITLVVVCALALCAQTVWVLSLHTSNYLFADTQQLMDSAHALLAGDMAAFNANYVFDSALTPGKYFALYPFQAGMLYVFCFFVAVFGDFAYTAFQLANALANTATIVALYYLACALTKKQKALNLVLVLSLLCLPLLFSCALVYSNAMGLALAAGALAFFAHALDEENHKKFWLKMAASFALMLCAVVVKNTTLLFLIAMAVVLLIKSIEARRITFIVIALVGTLLVMQCNKLPIAVLEAQTGQDFGDGMPKTSWIAMGITSDNSLGLPGWWGFLPYNMYLEAEGDINEQSALAAQSIKGTVTQFAENPKSAFEFFSVKLESEWAEPSFQTLLYSSYSVASETITNGGVGRTVSDANPVLNSAASNGRIYNALLVFMDQYQLLIYGGFATFCALGVRVARRTKSMRRKATNGAPSKTAVTLRGNASLCTQILLPTCIGIGFVVYVLWEAKSIYTLPFFVLMLPCAGLAIDAAFRAISARH